MEGHSGLDKINASYRYFDDVKKQADEAYKALQDFQLKVIKHALLACGFKIYTKGSVLVVD